MMNGSLQETEYMVTLTNKGRCQAGEGWDWSRPVNRSPTRDRNTGGGEMGDNKEGQKTDVMSDKEVRVTNDADLQRRAINNSD